MAKKYFFLRLITACAFFLFVLSSGIHWVVYTDTFNDYAQRHIVDVQTLEKNTGRAGNTRQFVKQRYADILTYLAATDEPGWRTQLIGAKRYLSRKERDHLLEVKQLLYVLNKLVYVFLALSIAGTVFYFWRVARSKHNLRALLKIMAWVLMAGFIVLSGLSPVFLEFFIALHQVLFTPGTWLFSSRDLIVNLFPLNYFLLGYAIMAVYVLGWFLLLLSVYWLCGFAGKK